MRRKWLIGIVIFLSLFPLALFAIDTISNRTAFLAALSDLQHGNQKDFYLIANNLHDYPLYPYLIYSELVLNLPKVSSEQIQSFLDTYHDTPLADHLRHLWLTQLAAQHQWQLFLSVYQPTKMLGLECDQRKALWQTGETELALNNFGELLNKNSAMPQACLWVFAQALHQGSYGENLVWERITLAFADHNPELASQLSVLLPGNSKIIFKNWLEVYNHPELILKRSPLSSSIVLTGLMRLTENNPHSTAVVWNVLNKKYRFDVDTQQKAIKMIALSLARAHDPSASAWLLSVSEKYVDDEVRDWRIRTGLVNQNWPVVETNINALPMDQRKTSQWRYWLARAMGEQNRAVEAQNIYRDLALHGDYYGQLASVQLNQQPLAGISAQNVNVAQLDAIASIPALRRAAELYQLKWLPEATQEWQWAIKHMPQEDYLAAAQLAMQWGWFERAIDTVNLISDGADIPLRFPLAYREPIVDAALKNNLDPAWVFALIRQESLFMPEVKSSAGALGLMQLMPHTAALVANEAHMSFMPSTLLNPQMNVELGSIYLRHMLGAFNNNMVLATAAYNAGPGNVKKWISARAMPADIWIETIPFHETRTYVKNIMSSMTFYEKELSLPETLTSRIRNPVWERS